MHRIAEAGLPLRFSLDHAAAVLLGLAWSVPFLWPYRPLPLGGFYSEVLAFGLALTAVAVLPGGRGLKTFPVPVAAWGFLAFAGLIVLQVFAGQVNYTGDGITAARYLGWAAMLTVLGARLGRTLGLGALATVLSWFLVASGCASAAAALIQLYEWNTPLNFLIARHDLPDAIGNIGNSAHFAGYVALAIASAAYLHARSSLHWTVALVVAGLLLTALGLSGRRAAWLYLALIAVLSILFHWRRRNAESARLAAHALLLLPGFLLAQWALQWPVFEVPKASLSSLERLQEVMTSVTPRLRLAQVSWDMFVSNPLWGAGWGQFARHYFMATAELGVAPALGAVVRNAHNLPLHLLAETGVVGAGLLAAMTAVWLWGLTRASFDAALWWVLALLGALAIHSLLEFPLWYAFYLGIAAILLGMGSTTHLDIGARTGAVVTVLTLVAGTYLLVVSTVQYRQFERALYASQAMTPEQRDAVISQQLELGRDDPHLAPYVEFIVSRSMAISDHRLAEKLQLSSRVMGFAPVSHVAYRHAMLLALARHRREAEEQLGRAARAYPDALPDAIRELERLAQRYPKRLEPLLQIAAARSAPGR